MKNNNLMTVISVILVLVMIAVGATYVLKSISNIQIPIVSSLLNMFNYKTETKFDTLAITARAMEMSDLVTAATECTGTIKYERYEEKFGPDAYAKYLLNYSSEIESRIDMSEITIEEKGSKVLVRMPNPTIKYNAPRITDFHLIDDSFRDVSLTEGQMLLEACKLIPDDIKKRVNLNVMKDKAKRQAKIIIRDLIKTFDKENKYTVEFEFFYDSEVSEDISQILHINN